jgi:hypothetical protein
MAIVYSSDHAQCQWESSTPRTFPLCFPVYGTQCKQTRKRVRFWAKSSFLECVNMVEPLKAAGLLWVILGVTKLTRELSVAENEVSSVMCRSVTEELTPGRRQWYQVRRFPNFVARRPLLDSVNSYGSWRLCSRKYRIFGWYVSKIKNLYLRTDFRQILIHTGSTLKNALHDLAVIKIIVAYSS